MTASRIASTSVGTRRMGQGGLSRDGIMGRARGAFRGVVIGVKSVDTFLQSGQRFLSPMVRVLPYPGTPGISSGVFVDNVLWTVESAGVHEGSIRLPRVASRILSTGAPFNPDVYQNPLDLDGEHVIVGYLNGDFRTPYVIRSLPHPKADEGSEQEFLGRRVVGRVEDSRADLRKFQGAIAGIDSSGNVLLDAREGYAGDFGRTGKEPRYGPVDEGERPGLESRGISGNVRLQVREGASIDLQVEDPVGVEITRLRVSEGRVEILSGTSVPLATISLETTDDGPVAKVVFGGGTGLNEAKEALANAKRLEALYNDLKIAFDTHRHGYTAAAVSESGTPPPIATPSLTSFPTQSTPPDAPLSVSKALAGDITQNPLMAPDWDPAIVSDRVLVPDTVDPDG